MQSTKPSNQRFSFFVLILCWAIMVYGNMGFYPRWNKAGTESTIAYDVEGYYWYLPSIFIYKNLKTQRFDKGVLQQLQATGKDNFDNGFIHSQSGNYVMKYSSGMAFMYAPAFAIGHMAAAAFHYPQTGFSAPYLLALQLWGLCFALFGLYFLRKLLKLFYTDRVVGIVLLLLVLGTNYLNYASIDIGMSHSWLFVLYVFLLLNTHYFYKSLENKYALRIGFLIGLMTLIRPTEIISVLIPLLWGISSWQDAKDRLSLFGSRKALLALVAFIAFAFIAIQLFYWHWATGDWIVYSYQDQGFNFRRPHAVVYSWSYRAGWLRYSPMMLLAFIGLLPFFKSGKNTFAIISFFVLNYYIVSAWNIWDYGGFSGRAMIQSYPVLLFPIASFVALLLQKRYLQWIFLPLILLFVYINIWWTYQAHWGGLVDPFTTTKEYYYKMVGRWSLPEKYQRLKDTDELPEAEPLNKLLLFKLPLVDSNTICDTLQNIVIVDTFLAPYSHKWLRVQADFLCLQREVSVYEIPQLIVEFKQGEKSVKTRILRVHRFLEAGKTEQLYFDVKIPELPYNSVKISLWAAGSKTTTLVHNAAVFVYD